MNNIHNRVLAAVNLGEADFSSILKRANSPVPGKFVKAKDLTQDEVRAALDFLWQTKTIIRCGSPYGPRWRPFPDSREAGLQQPPSPAWKAIMERCPAPPAADPTKLPPFFSLHTAIKRALLEGPANTSLLVRRITAAYHLALGVVNVLDVIAACKTLQAQGDIGRLQPVTEVLPEALLKKYEKVGLESGHQWYIIKRAVVGEFARKLELESSMATSDEYRQNNLKRRKTKIASDESKDTEAAVENEEETSSI